MKTLMNAFEYTKHPKSGLPISAHVGLNAKIKNNPLFVGFDVNGNPITSKEVLDSAILLMDGLEIPVYEEYALSGMDKYNQPIYTETRAYMQELKDLFIQTYDKYCLAVFNMSAGEYWDMILVNKPVGSFILGFYDIDSALHIEKEINEKVYITDINGAGIPLWNGYRVTRYEEETQAPEYCEDWGFTTTYYPPISRNTNVGNTSNLSAGSTGVYTNYGNYGARTYFPAQKPVPKSSEVISNLSFLKGNKPKMANVLLSEENRCVFDEHKTDDFQTAALGKFTGFAQSIVGVSHIKSGIPCQDSSLFFNGDGFDLLIVSDGAGSAELSHVGSKTLVNGIKRLIVSTYHHVFKPILDSKTAPTQEQINALSTLLTKHGIGLIKDLSEATDKPMDKYNATLILALVGSEQMFWLKIGDGGLVIQQTNGNNEEFLYAIEDKEKSKGEFANETYFVSVNLPPEKIQAGVLQSQYITAIMAMSNGVSERVISNDGTAVSYRLNDLLEDTKHNLFDFLMSDEFRKNQTEDGQWTNAHNGDDCSFAYLSRKTDAITLEEIAEQQRKEAEAKAKEEARLRQLAAPRCYSYGYGRGINSNTTSKTSNTVSKGYRFDDFDDDFDYFNFNKGVKK